MRSYLMVLAAIFAGSHAGPAVEGDRDAGVVLAASAFVAVAMIASLAYSAHREARS